jgi:hypothetical protein
MHVGGLRGGQGGPDHADARIDQQALGLGDCRGAHPVRQRVPPLARENRGALDGGPVCDQYVITRHKTRLANQFRLRHVPEHLADDDWPIEPRRDLGVPAADAGAQRVARLRHVRHDGVGQIGRRRAFGQQDDGEEPARPGAQHGHVVRVHVHRVGADAIGREGHRVGGDHQGGGAKGQHRGVLAGAGTHDDALVVAGKPPEQGLELGGGEFSNRQAARHGR